jgi:hypothetical protein
VRRRAVVKRDWNRELKGSQLAGKTTDFGEEHIGHGGIIIVLENISSDSSLDPLLTCFISSGSKLESLLI